MRSKLGCFIFLMIMMTSQIFAGAVYYVDATGGDDLNDGLSPETAWQTISKVNGFLFYPGDNIYFKRGEVWRDELVFPSSGSSGNTITISAYGTENDPIIKGSEALTGWTLDSGNVWKVTESTTVGGVFFIETDDSISWGIKHSSKGDLSSEHDWYHDGSNTLYVYAATDPDTRYNAVEVAIRYSCVQFNQSYVTVKNLEACFSKHHGIIGTNYGGGKSNQIIEYNTIHHIGAFTGSWWEGNGATVSSSFSRVRHNLVYEIARRGLFRHVLVEDTEDIIFEHNKVRNCYYDFSDAHNTQNYADAGLVIRYNEFYCDDDFMSEYSSALHPVGIYAQNPKVSYYAYYNIIHGIPGVGIAINNDCTGGNIYI